MCDTAAWISQYEFLITDLDDGGDDNDFKKFFIQHALKCGRKGLKGDNSLNNKGRSGRKKK